MKILVVDDELDMQTLFQQKFRKEIKEGIVDFVFATSGEQAMDYLNKNSSNNKNYGFAGWTVWSTGHGWGDYKLRVTPDSWHMQVFRPFL